MATNTKTWHVRVSNANEDNDWHGVQTDPFVEQKDTRALIQFKNRKGKWITVLPALQDTVIIEEE